MGVIKKVKNWYEV